MFSYFGTPTYEQNKEKLLLRKFLMAALHARGMIVQDDLEFFFVPALAAQPNVRAAGSPEDLAAASELKQTAMLQQIEDLQRQLAAVKDSVDEPCAPGVLTISDLAVNPAALDAFGEEEYIAVAFDIPQPRSPFFPYPSSRSRIKFPNVVPS